MKIYISIPITGHPLEKQKQTASQIAQNLIEQGHEPINPFDTDQDGMTYGQYLGKDITLIIDQADAILMAEGWEDSKGCNLELSCAEIFGKQVIYATPPVFAKHRNKC